MASSTMTVLTDREWAVEVDTALAAFWKAEEVLAREYAAARQGVFRAAGMRPWTEDRGFRDDRPVGTLDDALAEAEKQAVEPTTYKGHGAKRALAAFAAAKEALAEVKAAQEPFNEEYQAVRWNRAFLVLNNNGHVHKDRNCSTCFPTTQYGWLPTLSGADEAYIVEQSGESACTVCFPSAPVASLSQPRRVFHETEQEAQQAREERAAAKAEREAKKIAKAITTPEGEPLEVFDWTVPERHERQRDGSIKVTPARDRFQVLPTLAQAKTWLTDSQEGWGAPKRAEDVQAVAEAIAFKNGTTPQDEIAAAAKRAAKRK